MVAAKEDENTSGDLSVDVIINISLGSERINRPQAIRVLPHEDVNGYACI